MSTEHERVEVRSRAELRDWLTANHGQAESIWLVTYKKVSAKATPCFARSGVDKYSPTG